MIRAQDKAVAVPSSIVKMSLRSSYFNLSALLNV